MRESLARWQANGCSMFHDDAPKLRALDGERDLITEKQSKNATEQRSVARQDGPPAFNSAPTSKVRTLHNRRETERVTP
jgi:hypothetical protein